MPADRYILMPYVVSEWEPVTLTDTPHPSSDTIDLSDDPDSSERRREKMDGATDEERFWGHRGEYMGSDAENHERYTRKLDEPWPDVYARELEQDRREQEGPAPTEDEMRTLREQFGML